MYDAETVLGRIPEIDQFPSMDTFLNAFRVLVQRQPQHFRLRRIGTSRLGEPLHMLSAGSGPAHALLVGGPHPNEPIGFLTLLHFAELLAEDAGLRDGLGYTWNLIPCIDPDAARLNEGWYVGPLTIDHYHRHFYRPALGHQPEWTFPILDDHAYFDRTLPETQALMRVIDELRPHFQYALHNADFGGAYFVVSRDVPGLADKLTDAARAYRIPLELNPSEAAGWPVAGSGVFVMPPAHDMLTHQGRDAEPYPHGGSSSHYADRYGTLTLITEAPMWQAVDPSGGEAETGRSYGQTMSTMAISLRQDVNELGESLRRITPELRTSSVFTAAVADTLAIGRAYVHRWEAASGVPEAYSRPITAADLASAELTAWRTPLRATAMLLRLLRVECEAGNHRPVLRAELKANEERFTRGCARAMDGVPVNLVPLRNLVALQLTAALTAIAHL